MSEPVNLGPFRRIVGIGCSPPIPYVAFSTGVLSEGTAYPTAQFEDHCDAETAEVIPQDEMDTIFSGPGASGSSFAYRPDLSLQKVLRMRVWNAVSGDWMLDDFSVVGMPVSFGDSIGFGEWEYIGLQTVDIGWNVPLVKQGGLSVPPDSPSDFTGPASPGYSHKHRPYTGDPECYRTAGPGLFQVRYGTTIGGPETVLDQSLPLGSVFCQYLGSVYRPVATAIVYNDANNPNTHVLWVLCQRD